MLAGFSLISELCNVFLIGQPSQIQGKPSVSLRSFRASSGIITSSGGLWVGDKPFDFPIPVLLGQIILIFVISRLIRSILKHLGQPQFISDLVAGIILSPSLLSKDKHFQALVFPIQSWINLDIISLLACMLFIFVIGVKTDLNVIRISGKKALAIAELATIIPFCLSTVFSFTVSSPSSHDNMGDVLTQLCTRWAITSNSVLACLLDELSLLTTKLGRLALFASLISDLQHMFLSMLFSSIRLGTSAHSAAKGFFALSVFAAYTAFIIFVARPVAMWMIRRIPEGGAMDEAHFLTIVLLVLKGKSNYKRNSLMLLPYLTVQVSSLKSRAKSRA